MRAAYGLDLNPIDRRIFKSVAGERHTPSRRVNELWAIAGRRSGKTRMAAVIASYIACFIEHRDRLAPGQQGFILTSSPTLAQAQLVCSYCQAFLESSPIQRRNTVVVEQSSL